MKPDQETLNAVIREAGELSNSAAWKFITDWVCTNTRGLPIDELRELQQRLWTMRREAKRGKA